MKRITLAAFGACALVAVTATASAQSTPPTKEPGKLIVGFDVPAPGFWNGRVSGTTLRNPSGFEHSLSLAMGDLDGDALRCAHDARHPLLHAGDVVRERPELGRGFDQGALGLRFHAPGLLSSAADSFLESGLGVCCVHQRAH